MDRSTAVFWPEPQLAVQLEPESGPVLVQTAYTVDHEREGEFLGLMAQVRLSRLRTGAMQWSLYRDGESAHRFVEQVRGCVVGGALRQHGGRYTGFDQDIEERVTGLPDPPPQTPHLIAADLEE